MVANANGHYLERYVGESELVTLDFAARLADGQTLTGVSWTSDAGVTLEAGTSAVQGTKATGRFTTPTAGEYTVTAAVTCANPTETKVYFAILQVKAIPT